jgi:hypothetical protein
VPIRNYDAEVTDGVDELRNPVVTAAAGAAALAVGGAATTYAVITRLPVIGPAVRKGVDALSAQGEPVITHVIDPVRTLVTTIAVEMVEQILAELDLTTLVRENVDVNAIAAEFDIDAIVDRIDLIGLANKVIDGVDLPAIIRESTNSVTAEVMTDVRTQGERADDLVAGIVDRVLGRSREPQ